MIMESCSGANIPFGSSSNFSSVPTALTNSKQCFSRFTHHASLFKFQISNFKFYSPPLMNKSLAPLLASLLLTSPALAKLNVVASTPDLASIAKEIGGDHIELTTLGKATEDPHFVD